MNKTRSFLALCASIIISEVAGWLGSLAMNDSASWYQAVAKPALTPPDWVFAPVWVALYALMGIAAFLVWRKGFNRRAVRSALLIFVFQLALNVFWSFVFFGLRDAASAFIELTSLWFAILATILSFAKLSRPAAWLLLPYILWVTFAGYLNYGIWQMSVAGHSYGDESQSAPMIDADGGAY